MNLIISDHALKRMRQRSITKQDIKHVLRHPLKILSSFQGRKQAVGQINRRSIKVVYIQTESYIKIITVV
ncbi:hypothetical protein CMO92_03785 [Candidatus Woesearchaeota archaeon]|nr:hypothetical protein [Candidatus Woesearchaeota archaeon]